MTNRRLIREEYFNAKKSSPNSWAHESLLMFRASRLLFDRQSEAWAAKASEPVPKFAVVDSELAPHALLLTGYSVELLFKACALANGEPYEKLHIHELDKLANMAGFQPNEGQSELLGMLERTVVWSGRYPVPKQLSDFDYRLEVLASKDTPALVQETRVLYEEIHALFNSLNEAQLSERNKGG